MTDQTTENGGPSLSFEKVPTPWRDPNALPASGPVPDKAAASLAFEATPRTPASPAPGHARLRRRGRNPTARRRRARGSHHACTRAPSRSKPCRHRRRRAPILGSKPHTFQAVPVSAPATPDPGAKPHAFQAVPASAPVGVAHRMSTATIGFRPQAAEVASVSRPGGQGWNDPRPGCGEHDPRSRRADRPRVVAAHTPAKYKDRSAWDVPAAPRSRRHDGRGVVGVFLAVVLVAILGFAAYA